MLENKLTYEQNRFGCHFAIQRSQITIYWHTDLFMYLFFLTIFFPPPLFYFLPIGLQFRLTTQVFIHHFHSMTNLLEFIFNQSDLFHDLRKLLQLILNKLVIMVINRKYTFFQFFCQAWNLWGKKKQLKWTWHTSLPTFDFK